MIVIGDVLAGRQKLVDPTSTELLPTWEVGVTHRIVPGIFNK